MKTKSCLLFSILYLLMAMSSAAAQPRLTEAEAIDLALKNHPRLKAAAAEVQQASILGKAPLAWSPARIYQHTAADPDFGMFGTLSLGISQDFPSGKMTSANRTYYQRLEQRGMAAAQLSAVELKRQVREIYHHLSYLEARKGLLQRLDSVYHRVAEAAVLREKAGEASLAERLSAQDKASQIRLSHQTVNHEIEFDRLVLGQLLGLGEPVVPIVEPLHEGRFSLSDTSLLYQAAWVKLYDAEIGLADAEHQRQLAALRPAFSSSVFMQYLGNEKVFPGWEIGVSLPLAKKGFKARIEAAQVGVEKARAEREAALQARLNALAHLLHEQEKYLIAIDYYHEAGQHFATQLFRHAELNYRLGEMSYADLALALEQATQIELQYLENLLGLNLTLIELEALTTP